MITPATARLAILDADVAGYSRLMAQKGNP
jgi:hypothetical protein